VGAGYRISGWICNSTLRYLAKYEINEDIRCIEVFHFHTEDMAFFIFKAVPVTV
jgi:hypothetical protein